MAVKTGNISETMTDSIEFITESQTFSANFKNILYVFDVTSNNFCCTDGGSDCCILPSKVVKRLSRLTEIC